MAFDFFGFKIIRSEKETKELERKSVNSIVPPLDTEGSVVSSGGYFGTSYSLEFSTSNENLLINKYREIALQDRKSTRLNSSHMSESRMPSSA